MWRENMNLENYKKVYWEIEKEILETKKKMLLYLEKSGICSTLALLSGISGTEWMSLPLNLSILQFPETWSMICSLLIGGVAYDSLKEIITLKVKSKFLKFDKQELFLETEVHEYLLEQEQKLIKDLSELFLEMKLTFLEEIEAVYVFMLKGGYLSFAHHWHLQNETDIHYSQLITSIIRGTGCCRNIADLLANIEKNLNFDVSKTYMSFKSAKEDEPYLSSEVSFSDWYQELGLDISKVPYLKEKTQEKGPPIKFSKYDLFLVKTKKIPNHVIVTTKHQGIVTHFDPTNDIYLQTGPGNTVKRYNETKNMKVFNPDFSQRYGNFPNPSQKELYDIFNSFYRKCFYDYEKVFQKFYKDHQETYWQIKKCSDEIFRIRTKQK